ncbi:hypothetical protein AgCh_022228 [Apium graveolens]
MCRYGFPRILVTDNGTQFNNEEFKKYCEENEIELRFTFVAHPQANGQAEVVNRIILDGLKKRIEKSRNNWVDEILPILWAYRTTCRVTTGATPFMLAYRVEADKPADKMSPDREINPCHLASKEPGPIQFGDKEDPTRSDSHLVAALGINWAHAVTIRLVLESISGQRFIKVAKSPISPPFAFPFNITASGILLLSDDGREMSGPQINSIRHQGHGAIIHPMQKDDHESD